MQTLIGPGLLLTMDDEWRVLEQAGVLVEGDEVRAVGEFSALRLQYPATRHLDARGMVIMPGLINAHAHFYGMYARGLSLKDPPPQTFRQVLERLWWRLDKALDPKAVYFSAALGAAAALRAGCTTVIDHHASPNAILGSLSEVAQAVEQVGLRACLCYEVTDRDGPDRAAMGIAENLRFAAEVQHSAQFRALFGLHASFTVGPATMRRAVQEARSLGLGFHIHCAEGPEDGAHSLVHHGRPVAKRLLDEGLLGPQTILAHGVHLSEAEMVLLAETGTAVSHQPHSNLGNAVGFARILHMQERGVPVLLGTDGYTWDMFETMKAAAVLHSHSTGVPGAGVGEFAGVLLRNNAALASRLFGRPVGRLAPGAAADLILVEYHPPTPVTPGNLPWHIQFGMQAAQVHTVMAGGQVVLENRRVLGLDEAEVARAARAHHAEVWERF